MFGLRQWRRRRILSKSGVNDATWQRVTGRFSFVARLNDDERTRLRELAVLFMHGKQISAAGGLELNQEMKLGIAVQACVPPQRRTSTICGRPGTSEVTQ